MKRKLKDFLTKRVISATLSAAIAFNMVAYFPMSATAHDETSAETTVDLNDIKVSGQLMSNGYLAMNVLSNGHFSFGTTGGNPDNPKDDNKRLLYGFSGNSTSYTTIRIDNSSYVYSSTQNEFNVENKNNTSKAVYSDVEVQQVLSIVKNPATGNDDLIEVKYIVTNNSDVEKNVGLRIMMDTMLGGNDQAPFRVPQYGSVTTETEYEGDEIPQFWQAFDSLTSPTVIAQGRLYQTKDDRPDKVQFCNWRSINGTYWDYHTTVGRGNGDSAVAMTWNETALAPNETREYVTSYGLSEFTEDLSLPLGLSVYSDSELSVVNNQYAPNPVDVTAYVQNLSTNTAEDVHVSIELPDNLTLTNNSEQTIDIGTMTPNQLEQASWSVYVSPSAQNMTYHYTVVLTAANGYEKRVSRSIHVPALQAEVLSPYVLFSGSDSSDFTLNCWKSTFNGDVYTGRNFISNASELYLNGNVNAVDSVSAYGWKVNIEERNEHSEKEDMPDWDSRIIAMAGDCETSDEDVVKIEDKNVIDSALKTTGNVIISGTVFDGNCYIIADGNITYNVNVFKSSGRVVLYSRNGDITINGTNIDVNGILYAPNGKVVFNSNEANINGRIFADKINFNGSVFNVNGSDSDWELLGRKAVIAKTYTFDEDFNEGEYDGLGLDIADELTLEQRTNSVSTSSENVYKDNNSVNGIALNVKTDKSVLTNDGETLNVEFDLTGFGLQEVEENNVDLAIVVDTSGSMSGTRRNNAVSAAKEVVSQMKPGDRCAIIKFTTNATVLQEFSDDTVLLNTAIDKLDASGGTSIATGINKAVELFDKTNSDSRQKYIILMSDGEDSSASAKAATDAYDKGITICALSIGSHSSQMETIANNTRGYYKNSPTAEQIGEMMSMFADVVFNNAGTDVTFTATLNRNTSADIDNMTPAPVEIIENENGTKTLKWTFDKIAIDQSEKISLPVFVNSVAPGLNNIISGVSCTYYNRAGVSNNVYADDIILPSHTYKQEGSWTAVYDSKVAGTEWEKIYWNGKLYDDSVLSVLAQTGDDLDAFGEWTEITNHKDITDLKGRYIRVKVNMVVSSSGKTPELYDITLLSDGADKVNYVNNAPVVSVSGNTTTSVSKKITLISTAEDDAFNSKLSFDWSCGNENVQIFGSNKPYASFKFNESGTYDITLSVSDDSSTSVVTRTITVLNDDVLVKPMIDIDVPPVVKSGATISGRIINLNDAEIAEYEVLVGGNTVNVSSDGQFSFTAPESDTIIAVEAKAFNIVGVSGSADKSIIVDATAPTAQLKADKNEVNVNETVTITAFVDDENGISDYSLTLDGEVVSLDSNYQFSFVPTVIGSYAFELNVTDMAGHSSSASLTINVVEGKAQPVVRYSIPRVIMLGETGDFTFVSDSDAVVTVKVNGEVVQLDADGKFSYTPDAVGNLTINIHATNGGNTDTDFTLTVPVVKIELLSDKTNYTDEELITVKLVYSDNLTIISQTATIDNIPYAISDDTIQADRLDAGSHQVVWYAEDENGNIYTGTMMLTVQDMVPPEIEVVLSENALKPGDSVEAIISATDRYGIDSVSATFDGTSIAVSENKIVLTDLTAGTHILAVTATDNNGISSTYNYELTVSAGDTTPPELEVSVSVGENRRIEITASANDDSGNAEITGTVNGKKLTFNNGTAYYDPDDYGTFEIVIRAEDAAGNYTEKTQTVTISEQIKEYELKLSVGLDKNHIKPNETANITIRTNALLEDVTISCAYDGGNLTQTETGFAFVSDKEGTFKIVITAADESGNSVSETVYITVSKEQQVIDDDHEGEGEYENTYTPEPRARVVLNSNENVETKMTEEMAELADHLKTPLAVYEYLYNNLNTEYYVGSRKGAIGAYEQKGGNDVDCSSLLIAMLRYLGYEANYVTGTVEVTADQLMGLTATDTAENAEKVFILLGRPLTRSNGKYIFDRTWVKTVINGKEYQLDVNFKKFSHASGISDEIQAQNFDFDYKNYTSLNAAEALFNEYKEQDTLTDLNLSGRKLVNKKITKLPLYLPYTYKSIYEEIHNIYDSKVVTTDCIEISFGRDVQLITAPTAYISTVSIQYVPSSSFYNLFKGIIEKPSSIYDSTDNYLTGSQKSIVPALYLDNKKIYEWNATVGIGDKQMMYISTSTGGQERKYVESRELIVGSIVSIVVDTQMISPQSLLTGYKNYNKIKNTINENNFYDSSYCDNYLNLIGNAYFAQLDIQNIIYSSAYNVYKERELSFGLFTYEPNVKSTNVMGYTTSFTLEKQGHFGLDIIGVHNQVISLSGNYNDETSYLFASGYVSSYLESQTLQQFTGVKSISTAEVFRQCNENGIELKIISSENEDIISTLQISAEDKAKITQKVNEGYIVIVPEKNITVNQWTGTAYIVQSRDGNQNSFIITGNKNGGYNTTNISAYLIIATIGAGVDMYGMVFGFVGIVSACLALPVAPLIAVAAAATALVVFTNMVVMWIEDYKETVDLYSKAMGGNVDAANKLNGKAFMAAVSMFFDFAMGGFGGSKCPGPDDIPLSNGRKTALLNKGYTDDVIDNIFSMNNATSCSDELLESIAKSSKPSEVAGTLSKYSDDIIESLNKSADKDTIVSLIAKHGDEAVEFSAKSSPDTLRAIANLADDKADDFFKTVSKHGDELTSALNKSANINDAVSFVSKYSDDGAEIFLRYGDDAIAAVKGCDAPYKAVQIIKNGGLQYGDEAVQALKKSGDKAIEALTKVPTKDCAKLINDVDTNVLKAIVKEDDSFTKSVINTFSGKQKQLYSILNNSGDRLDEVVALVAEYGDDTIDDLLKVYEHEQISGVYMYLDNLKVKPETMDGVWSQRATKRGIDIENYFAATKYRTDFHIGAEYNGYFPVIDFVTDDTIISMKTLDPRLSSYQNLAYLEDVVDKYASALNDFRLFQGGNEITNKTLEIIIPTGSLTDEINMVIDGIRRAYPLIDIQIEEMF